MSSAEVRLGELTADFGKTAGDYGRHRAGFPDEFFERLMALGILSAGMRATERHMQPAKKMSGRIVLQTAHRNHLESDGRKTNLFSICQCCHLRFDKTMHVWRRRGRILLETYKRWTPNSVSDGTHLAVQQWERLFIQHSNELENLLEGR
ncbi:MAG: hypothetical protein WCE23_11445 [Candidatus Binatus sp.]|uniref:hypothetical protein n=1 Tax=Candidatus Binatus sp. TaxID=2811406 RepID=UPI003C745D00